MPIAAKSQKTSPVPRLVPAWWNQTASLAIMLAIIAGVSSIAQFMGLVSKSQVLMFIVPLAGLIAIAPRMARWSKSTQRGFQIVCGMTCVAIVLAAGGANAQAAGITF